MMFALALVVLFWGLWANTMRVDRKWRFELFAFDFAIGAGLVALLLALTLGNAGSADGFTFDDNLTVASKRNMATAVAAGAIFCVANVMTMAGIALAGMSTALPVAAAAAMIVTVILSAFGRPAANPGLVYGAAGVALGALVAAAMAQKVAAAAKPVKKTMHPAWKGFILSIVGGLIAGAWVPVAESSRGGDIGMGSYGTVVFLTIGLFLMTPLVNLYFLNLPVQGEALSLFAYTKGSMKQHLLGLAGGAIWVAGSVAFFAAAGALYSGAPKLPAIHGAGYGAAVLAGVCGLTLWGEPAGAPKAKGMLFATLALLAAGAGMLYAGA